MLEPTNNGKKDHNPENPEPAEVPSKPVRVLLVEDELIVAEDLRRRLIAMGYEVTGCVATGEESVRRSESDKPDVVLMDISLRGDMDGVDAGKKIYELTHIPIVYVTGHGDPDTLLRAKSTPNFSFVLKPIEDRELHYILEMALYRGAMSSTKRKT